jgi:cytochrome c peroxidase
MSLNRLENERRLLMQGNRRKLGIVLAGVVLLLAGALAASAAAPASLTPIEELGSSIYFDQSLSINQNQACAACHGATVGWTGPDEPINMHGAVYEGSIPGRFGDRKPPSAAYAAQSPIFHLSRQAGGTFVGGNFWDGRATGEKLGNPAADQAQGPFLNPKEQALPDSACVVYRVCTAAGYPVPFEAVWGTGACAITWPTDIDILCATEGATVPLSDEDRARSNTAYDNVALSIAAFEASSEVSAFTAKLDYARLDQAKLTKLEQKGYALFQGKGQCARCHVSNGEQALFTDYTYDNLGIPKNPENPVYVDDPLFVDPGLGGFLATRPDYALYAEANMGKHKVPTLRNVDLRPDPDFVKAYGHNGYFKSLYGIVHFYNTRDILDPCPGDYTEAEALAANCWPVPEVAENMNTKELGNLGLTTAEEEAIVAFLKTLSDGYVP